MKVAKIHNWLFADFETTGPKYFALHNYTKVYLAGLQDPLGNFWYYSDISTFWQRLQDITVNTIVYFHNLAFDITFLEYFWTKNQISYIKKLNGTGRIIYAEVRIKHKTYKRKRLVEETVTLQFRDSLLLLNGSLDALAKSFKLDLKIAKDVHFYDRETYEITQDEITYLKRDVDILRQLILIIFKRFDIVENPPLTAASLSRKNLYKECLAQKQHDALFSLPEELDTALRPYYYGGFCYLNPKYANQLLPSVSAIDVNSFYPAIMVKEPLIFGQPKPYKGYFKDPFNVQFHIIALNGELKPSSHPYLMKKGYLGKNNYITETDGDILIGLWDFEINLVKARYVFSKFEYITTYSFKVLNENPLKPYLLKLYQNKQITKGAEKQLNKIILNSLYGKYGQRPDNLSKIITSFYPTPENTGTEEFKTVSYVPLAMYITAKARFILNTYIDMFGDNFIYCDTDSIYFTDDLPRGIIISDKIGDWDLEHSKEPAKFLAQKIYKIGNTNKLVGLSKKAQQGLTFADYEYGKVFTATNLKQKKVEGGCILLAQDYEIKKR